MKPTQLPSGSWRCQVYIGKDSDGKRQYISITRPNKHDCIIEAESLAKHHHEVDREPSKMTLSEAMEKYLEIKSNVLSPSTIRSYMSISKNHFKPEQDIQLCKISSNVAQKAINREAKTCSPKTMRNVYGFLTAVLAQFSDKTLKITLPQKISKEKCLLSETELKKLIKELQNTKLEIPVLMALFLGMRKSEILAVTKDDYDPTTKTLNINKALVQSKHGFVLKTTKTVNSTRKISIPPYLAEKLEKCTSHNFCTISPSHLSENFNRFLDKHKISRIGLHDLRHQNASIMLMLGIADKYAMERGGWSSNATMKNIYQHTITSEKQEVDNRINSYFEGLTKD